MAIRQDDFTINCANLNTLQQGSSRECISVGSGKIPYFRADWSVNISIDNIVAFGTITGVNYDATGVNQVGISDASYETARLTVRYKEKVASNSWVVISEWDQTFPDYYPYIMINTLSTATSAVSLSDKK